MTRTQEKRAYRVAVQASLETFYGKSKPEATKLVRAWWSRLGLTRAFKSGVFLCTEAMNTAGHIAQVDVIAITAKNRDEYHRLLDESRDLVLAKTTYSAAQVQKLQTDEGRPFLHLSSSSGSSSARGTALRVLAKQTKEKKTAQKQQVAYS
jgi:hypothetical protein